VKPNVLDLTDLNFITNEVHCGMLKRSQLRENDVIMTITGRVGTASVIKDIDLPANINQHIVRLRVDCRRCLPDYLSAYLNTPIGLLLSNRPVSGGTRIALDYSSIRNIPVVLPDINIQEAISAFVKMQLAKESAGKARASSIWQQARTRFEEQLLHGVQS
jgi:hypothetical protein